MKYQKGDWINWAMMFIAFFFLFGAMLNCNHQCGH